MTKFSVIIPTYNRAEDLKRCLDSLCNQTFKFFEAIVCDDGSTDHTAKIVDQFKKKLNIQYLYSENWGGPAVPRNAGVRVAKGEWICFLDSDDWWFPTKLEECFKKTQKYNFIYHDIQVIKDNKVINNYNFLKYLNNPLKILKRGNFIACSSVCVKKDFLGNLHFPEDKAIISLEDYFLWIVIVQHLNFKPIFINKKLSTYYLSNNNISNFNANYLQKLFSFKRKLVNEIGIDANKTCLNYIIGINLKMLFRKKNSRKFFMFSFLYSSSLIIKCKSLIRYFIG